MEVLTLTKKRGRKPKVKETPNGGVQTKTVEQTNDFTKRGGFDKPVSYTENESGERIVLTKPTDEVKAPAEKIWSYEKHPLNFMPDQTDVEFQTVKDDMKKHGFDVRFPIYLLEDWLDDNELKVLEGWHRQKAAIELFNEGFVGAKYLPVYVDFKGTPKQANEFVWRTAKRRNLTQTQWGALAVFETPEYLESIRIEVKEKAKENRLNNLKKGSKKPVPSLSGNGKKNHKNETKAQVAAKFDSTPDIIDKLEEVKANTPADKIEQVGKDFINGKTIKEFESEKRAETKALETGNNVEKKVIILDSNGKQVLTDEEILKLAKIARNKVQKLKSEIHPSLKPSEGDEIFERKMKVNQPTFQKIDQIRKDLSIKLTE